MLEKSFSESYPSLFIVSFKFSPHHSEQRMLGMREKLGALFRSARQLNMAGPEPDGHYIRSL